MPRTQTEPGSPHILRTSRPCPHGAHAPRKPSPSLPRTPRKQFAKAPGWWFPETTKGHILPGPVRTSDNGARDPGLKAVGANAPVKRGPGGESRCVPFPELVPGTVRLSAPQDGRQRRAGTTDPPPPSKPARCQPAAPFIWPRSQQDSRWDLRPPSVSARLCPPPGPRSPFHLKKISLGTQTSRRGLQGGQKATLQLSYLCLGSLCLFVFLMRLPWERYCGHRAGRTDPQTWTPNQGRKTELQHGGCFSGPQG